MTAGKRRELRELESSLKVVENTEPAQLLEEERLRKEIAELRAKIDRVPFIDTFDLRYKNYEKRPEPSSRAVMFCLMDVSGSMDQATKDMAKRFYILLYLFLSRTYKNVEVVYIRHHTGPKRWMNMSSSTPRDRGTIVSSALKLMDEVVKERYDPAQWNIYAAQASDGDNWADDSPLCHGSRRRKFCRWCVTTAISKSPVVPTKPCGGNMNICSPCSITLPCSISAIRMIFILCSGSCSTSNLLPATHNNSQRIRWLFSTPFIPC